MDDPDSPWEVARLTTSAAWASLVLLAGVAVVVFGACLLGTV